MSGLSFASAAHTNWWPRNTLAPECGRARHLFAVPFRLKDRFRITERFTAMPRSRRRLGWRAMVDVHCLSHIRLAARSGALQTHDEPNATLHIDHRPTCQNATLSVTFRASSRPNLRRRLGKDAVLRSSARVFPHKLSDRLEQHSLYGHSFFSNCSIGRLRDKYGSGATQKTSA